MLLEELEKAEKFIFLEFFIVDEGEMWGRMLEILARKAAQGVDVRLLYDGTNEFFTLPRDYPQRLKKLGIQAKAQQGLPRESGGGEPAAPGGGGL